MNFINILKKLGRTKIEQHVDLTSKQQSLRPTVIGKDDPSFKSVKDIAYRLLEKDARNIALTGSYGSGKSSVLLTLKTQLRKQYNFLDISLATLKPYEVKEKSDSDQKKSEGTDTNSTDDNTTGKNKNSDEKKGEKESISTESLNRLIEYSILQQLIYREKPSTIPNSRFKRIVHIENWKVTLLSINILFAIIALYILFEPEWCRIDWLYYLLSMPKLNIIADSISIVFLFCFSYYIVGKFIRCFSNSKLNKLNLKDGEIEIEENTSIFNKHLDEILYFFQMTRYDVVIIEDLDRFDTTDIFLKLRELNNIINNSKVVTRKNKQPIAFIYAVRDDMFKDSERSKFFDYISTIIPIINPSNSKAMLKKELEERGITDIDDEGISDIAFFINDMRLLRNIANEYAQYKEKLTNPLLKSVNLLAMITYKNYFPRDFAELHYGDGVVYKCLHLKDVLMEKQIEELDRSIKEGKDENKRINEIIPFGEKELRTIYMNTIKMHINEPLASIYIDDSYQSIQNIIDNENLFKKLIEQKEISYQYYYCYDSISNNDTSIDFKSIEKEVDPNHTYQERLAVANKKIYALKINIEKIEQEKDELRSRTFCQLTKKTNLSEFEDYKTIDVPPMIEYFLTKGYINENYYDYISYFHEGIISKSDWEFILKLKLNRPQNPGYHIDNIENSIKEIPEYVYNAKAILNFDILDFLAFKQQTENDYSSKFKLFIKTAIDTKSYDFLALYYKWGKHEKDVFNYLFATYQDKLWKPFMNSEKNIPDLRLIWFIYAESEYGIEESKTWLENNYQFITENIDRLKTEHVKNLIEEKKYIFKELNNTVPDLMNTIIKNGDYLINSNNITVLVNHLLKRTDLNDDSINLSTIYETGCEELIQSAHDHLKNYITNIFKEPSSKKEKEKAIVYILETETLSEEEKKKYLSEQERTISQAQLTEEEDKTLAIQLFLITPSWEEVFDYMTLMGNTVTNDLSSYICHYKEELINLEMVEEDKERELLQNLIKTNILSLDTYQDILPKFKRWGLDGTDLSELEPKRIALLISYNMIKYTAGNTKMLQTSFDEDIQSKYFLQNKEEFVKDYTSIEYSAGLATKLLSSKELNDSEKSEIVKQLTIDFFEGSQELANETLALLTRKEIELDFDLNLAILKNATDVKNKITIISYDIAKNETLTEEDISKLLNTLPEPYSSLTGEGNEYLVANKYGIESILKILKKRHYIASYKEEKEKGFKVSKIQE